MKTYSFLSLVVLVNGIEIDGFADGDDAIQVERRVDTGTDRMGADGQMFYTQSADKSGEITLRLLPGSDSNKYLSDLCKEQESGIFAPISVLIQDTFRQDRGSAGACYLKKQATLTRGAGAANNEWVIVAENLELLFGDGV